MLSMKLIGFLMLAVRHEALSQILGLLVLENGIFLGAQILVPGMPLLIEIVILFDLLIVVACFGVLVRYLVDPCRQHQQPRAQAAGGLMMVGTLLAASCCRAWRRRSCCMLIRGARVAEALNLAASVVVFAGGNPRSWRRATTGHTVSGATTSSSIGLGAWVILCAAIVYLLASIYAVGYMRLLDEDERLPRFYALFAGFALTTLVGPMMNNAGLYWIAIELTTLVSTFLVAFEREAESIEAAWKYIIVVSAGISLALLGTVLFYWSGTLRAGADLRHDLGRPARRRAADQPRAGVACRSCWCWSATAPRSASRRCTPGCRTRTAKARRRSRRCCRARCSTRRWSASCAISPIADAARTRAPCRAPRWSCFGALSLLVARAVHRAPERHQAADGLFQRRAHGRDRARLRLRRPARHRRRALPHAQPLAEQVADVLRRRQRHAQLRHQGHRRYPRRVGRSFPVQGALWLAGAVAITGAPPFGLFLSELTILRAGLRTRLRLGGLVMAVLLIVIFIGFLNHFRAMYFDAGTASERRRPAPVSRWCVAPMWLALAPLLVFGLWWPRRSVESFHGAHAAIFVSGRQRHDRCRKQHPCVRRN